MNRKDRLGVLWGKACDEECNDITSTKICKYLKEEAYNILNNDDFDVEYLEDINKGFCLIPVVNTYDRLPDKEEINIVCGMGEGIYHSWIMYSGKHHDSTVPHGVDSVYKLPFSYRHNLYSWEVTDRDSIKI